MRLRLCRRRPAFLSDAFFALTFRQILLDIIQKNIPFISLICYIIIGNLNSMFLRQGGHYIEEEL